MCIVPVPGPWLIIMIFESEFVHYSESLLSCLGQCFRLIYDNCHCRTFALHKADGILQTELCFWNPRKGDFLSLWYKLLFSYPNVFMCRG